MQQRVVTPWRLFTLIAVIGLAAAWALTAAAAESATESEPVPVRLTDFTEPEQNARWYPLLDNVMGGRSAGELEITDGVLSFTGSINTDGGGFASIRLPVAAGTLAETTHIGLRVRVPDAPGLRERGPFRLILIDDLHRLPRGHADRRSRRITHRIDLPIDAGLAGEWQVVTVALADFAPSWRGRSMRGEAQVDAARVVELGLILNDATDGPFRLDVDTIDLYPAEP